MACLWQQAADLSSTAKSRHQDGAVKLKLMVRDEKQFGQGALSKRKRASEIKVHRVKTITSVGGEVKKSLVVYACSQQRFSKMGHCSSGQVVKSVLSARMHLCTTRRHRQCRCLSCQHVICNSTRPSPSAPLPAACTHILCCSPPPTLLRPAAHSSRWRAGRRRLDSGGS